VPAVWLKEFHPHRQGLPRLNNSRNIEGEMTVNGPLDMHALQASPDANEASRARRLKDATHETHDRLDKSIMAHRPFESQARYGLFLKVQHEFHREIAGLYASPRLDKLLPDLAKGRRFGLVEQDLADLGIAAPSSNQTPIFANSAEIDIPTAFGWLYVAEGSNLGAAFLLKAAQQLGLSEAFGARHLAAAPEGRGLHWKTFTAALDAVVLTGPEEERVTAGARAAFARVESLVTQFYAD
jgi:heme oxygenase (biliverdin-IX-beta and delta-forming)